MGIFPSRRSNIDSQNLDGARACDHNICLRTTDIPEIYYIIIMNISTTNKINSAKYDTNLYMAQPLQMMMMICKLYMSRR
jgi:hypothetical protein